MGKAGEGVRDRPRGKANTSQIKKESERKVKGKSKERAGERQIVVMCQGRTMFTTLSPEALGNSFNITEVVLNPRAHSFMFLII